MKIPIKVYIRLKPTNKFATHNIQLDEEKGEININIPKDINAGIINHQQENWKFEFNKLLVNESQESVFDLTAKELVINAVNGLSGCLLAYGQTGAGKTFTITGTNNDYKYRGLIPRIISLLFQEINNKEEYFVNVKASYIEIYNENIYDLLSPKSENFSDNNDNVVIQEDPKYGVFPKGAIIKECKTEEDALNVMFEGDTNRTISQHKLNKCSSRSHTIYTLILEIRSRIESSEKVTISKINIVDLAGSERTKKTGSEGQVVLEASFINKSLSYLEQLIITLLEKNREHIPYRQSKLNYLLKDSIGGNSKTHMIANIWPEKDHLEETISTLKFASRMMKVSNYNQENEVLDEKKLIKKYEREIKDLKLELAMHDTLQGRGRISYEPYTDEEQYEQQLIAEEFLNGLKDDIDIESIRQVKELFHQFRNIYRANIKEGNLNKKNKTNTIDDDDNSKNDIIENNKETKEDEKVGIEEKNFGFGLGKAPNNSKPNYKMEKSLINISNNEKLEETNNFDNFKNINLDKENNDSDSNENIDKKEEFLRFKENQGRSIVENIYLCLENIKENKNKFQNDSEIAQSLKEEILEMKKILDFNNGDKSEDKNLIDEEEFSLIKEIKEKKISYNNLSEKLELYKREIKNNKKNLTKNKFKLVDNFEIYLKEKYNISLNEEENKLIADKESSKISNKLTVEEELFNQAREKFDLLQKAKRIERIKGEY